MAPSTARKRSFQRSATRARPLSDPAAPELEQRFIQTLDRLDQVPQAIEGLRNASAQIESSLDEDGELMDRLTNIDLTVSGLLDRLEESGDDSESEEAPEADLLRDPSSEPSVKPQGILAWVCGWDSDEELDVALREACPLIFPPEEENSSVPGEPVESSLDHVISPDSCWLGPESHFPADVRF